MDKLAFVQTRDLTDDEWMKLSKKEILQLYKNCYAMLKNILEITDTDIKAYLLEHYKPILLEGNDVNAYFKECAFYCIKAVLNGEIKHIE